MSQTITTKLEVSDYGSNITITRTTYNNEEFIDSEVIFETNADQFLPDYSEYDEDWDVNQYINDYLSFYDFGSEEDKEFVFEALYSSKLRYLAVDAYRQWEEENNNQ